MKNFTYIKRDGSEGTVQANDASEAIRLAADRADSSGVQEERSLPSLDETGKPADESLPADSPSRLVAFTRATQRATALARQARNKVALSETGQAYPEGVLPDFGSILGSLNQSSDHFADDLIHELEETRKADEEANETKYEMRTVGRQLIQFQLAPDGSVIGQKVIATAPKESSGGGDTDFFANEQERDLLQGRLTGAAPEVQTAFVRMPKDFRDSWIRNNIQQDNSAVKLPALLNDLESWERWQKAKDSEEDVPTELFPSAQ